MTATPAPQLGAADAVSLVDQASLVAEFVSWLGFGTGIPLMVLAWILRLMDGAWQPAQIVIVRSGTSATARWFAGGEMHERMLADPEWRRLRSAQVPPAFFAERRPHRMELDPRSPLARAFWNAGLVLLVAGALATAASLLPLMAA